MDKLLGFGNGARTATAKVGKVIESPLGLIGFVDGEKAVTAKVGKIDPNSDGR